MLHSRQLKDNPSLYVFLPIFYTVWSDAILTPSEISTIEGLVNSQGWLTETEKSFLLTQIDPSTPPSPDDMIEWRETIKKVAEQSETKDSLVDLGIKLVAQHGRVNEALTKAKPSLSSIEETLGFISHEASFNFQSGS